MIQDIQVHEESIFFDRVRGRNDIVIIKKEWKNNMLFVTWRWKTKEELKR